MQKAFNKTIIKLQNTSRIAEEQVSSEENRTILCQRGLVLLPPSGKKQTLKHTFETIPLHTVSMMWTCEITSFVVFLVAQDQRQTESIQLLQGQLENVTQLVLNLSVRVSQLQIEVRAQLQAQSLHV